MVGRLVHLPHEPAQSSDKAVEPRDPRSVLGEGCVASGAARGGEAGGAQPVPARQRVRLAHHAAAPGAAEQLAEPSIPAGSHGAKISRHYW